MAGQRQYLQVQYVDDVMRVRIKRKNYLDLQAIGNELFSLAGKVGRKKMLLNLGNIHHMQSAFIGRLIVVQKVIVSAGGRLALCNIDPEAYTFCEGAFLLDKMFSIEQCPDDDPDDNGGGIAAPLKPCKPAGSGSVALPQPDRPPLPPSSPSFPGSAWERPARQAPAWHDGERQCIPARRASKGSPRGS